jgi:hypothetical protein
MEEFLDNHTVIENRQRDTRSKILGIENVISRLPNARFGDQEFCPLKHTFVDGAYVREIFMPKGLLIVSKLHKITHPYFILKGDVSVLTENGAVRIKAPYSGITKAGTKRILYIHEDTIWVTVHVTKETNIDKIEEEIIAKSYKDMGIEVDEELENNRILEFVEEVKCLGY